MKTINCHKLVIQNSLKTIICYFKPQREWYLIIYCWFYSPIPILVLDIVFCKYSNFLWKYSVSWRTEYFPWRESNKVLRYLFECIFVCCDYTQFIKEGVTTYTWMYPTIIWLFADHQIRCCTIYLDVFSSSMILCRASNMVLHYFKCALEMIYNKFSKIFNKPRYVI